MVARWVSPNGTPFNQIHHTLIEIRLNARTCKGANKGSNHYLDSTVLRAAITTPPYDNLVRANSEVIHNKALFKTRKGGGE